MLNFNFGFNWVPQAWDGNDTSFNAAFKTWCINHFGTRTWHRLDCDIPYVTSLASSIITNTTLPAIADVWADSGATVICLLSYGPRQNIFWASLAGFTGTQADITNETGAWTTWSALNWKESFDWPTILNSTFNTRVQEVINFIRNDWIASGGASGCLKFELYNEPYYFGWENSGGTASLAPVLSGFHAKMNATYGTLNFHGHDVYSASFINDDIVVDMEGQINDWFSNNPEWLNICTGIAIHFYKSPSGAYKSIKGYKDHVVDLTCQIYDTIRSFSDYGFDTKPIIISELGLTFSMFPSSWTNSYFTKGLYLREVIEGIMAARPYQCINLFTAISVYANSADQWGLVRYSDRRWSLYAVPLQFMGGNGSTSNIAPDGNSWLTGSTYDRIVT